MTIRSYATRCIHGGSPADPAHGGLLPPIHQTTTFRRSGVAGDADYSYSRCSNPTVSLLEERLGELEDAPAAVCFGSGLAALTSLLLGLCGPGDRVVCTDVIYGGTWRLLEEVLAPLGVRIDYVDPEAEGALTTALAEPARLLLLETPANPTLQLVDLGAAVRAGRAAGALVAVDNTFLTAFGQRPLDLGAHLSVCSTTKYVDGHNATIGGAVLSRDPELLERLRHVRRTIGTIQAPQDAWLTLQGLKTLPLRLTRQSDTALTVARALERTEGLSRVRHPWLESHPQYALARRQQSVGGGLVCFDVDGGLDAAARFLDALKLCSPAENLGAVETLITHPASTTHASVPAERRRILGVGDGTLRLSLGLEESDEILSDLRAALRAARIGRCSHA